MNQDPSAFQKFVEVGRGESNDLDGAARADPRFIVVLLKTGPYAGKTATIVEIIDHKRVSRSILTNLGYIH
jgi:hypothetical protein